DKSDMWNVLDALREIARLSTNEQIYWPVADSIDAAVSQEEISSQEFWEIVRRGEIPVSSGTRKPEPGDDRSKPTVMAVSGGPPSDEQWQQMIQEVWDFAGGKPMKWKRAGKTPAGRKCDVLTFSGSEEVLVSPTSIEIPPRSN